MSAADRQEMLNHSPNPPQREAEPLPTEGNDGPIGSLDGDESRMKLTVKAMSEKPVSDLDYEGAKAKQELSVFSALISLRVRADYLLYCKIPGHHGCFILQYHTYVSLTFPVAMPRLMMCAQATIQVPVFSHQHL